MNLNRLIISFTLVNILILSSCASGNIKYEMELTGVTWELTEIMGIDITKGVFRDQLPTIEFSDDGTVTGFTGCNNFRGTYSLEGTNVQIDPGAMTRKACPGDGEKRVVNGLNQTTILKVENEMLLLKNPVGTLLTYKRG